MTTITTDSFSRVKHIIDGLIEQAGSVIKDVEDTVAERARLEHEATEREAVIDQLNAENDKLREQVEVLERRNATLLADVAAAETRNTTLTNLLQDIRRAVKVEAA